MDSVKIDRGHGAGQTEERKTPQSAVCSHLISNCHATWTVPKCPLWLKGKSGRVSSLPLRPMRSLPDLAGHCLKFKTPSIYRSQVLIKWGFGRKEHSQTFFFWIRREGQNKCRSSFGLTNLKLCMAMPWVFHLPLQSPTPSVSKFRRIWSWKDSPKVQA